MIIQKVDNNNLGFKAELVSNVRKPVQERLKIFTDDFREQTKNFPDRRFLVKQISDDFATLQLVPKNTDCLVDGIYTSSLEEKFQHMTDSDIGKFLYSSFKLLALSEKYREVSNLINATRAEYQHNMELLKKFSEQSNEVFVKRYKKFSQLNVKKIKALNQELNGIRTNFFSLKESTGKKYPELLEVKL